MQNPLNLPVIVLFILTACSSTRDVSTKPTALPQPTATRVFPTPSAPGDPVLWRTLRVSMDQPEITDTFINEFGSQRVPSAGQKFLWIHLTLENVGTEETLLPEPENFSVLYAESEIKPIYGHRQEYADYSDSGATLFPGQELDAWLRFDIPAAADLSELWFVFLPTSSQVGASPSSPNYPYAENKPTYVWKCEP
ncbi:MAG TPA: DUF4352 domain-containing protein [Anaerolineales bacterium]|nr:DUF4352 domain-containing protein [Anaerolineales bacterium]